MYHIKSDKRSQTSARLIVDGLYKCLEHKKFSAVTISDIQRASTVGRATFYRLFDNLTDVLEYECDNAFCRMLAQYRSEPSFPADCSPFEALFIHFMEYWIDRSDLLDALTDCRRIDIMNTVFTAHTDEISEILVPDLTLTQTQLDYFVSVATCAIFGVFYAWARGGKKENAKELVSLLKCSVDTVEKSLAENSADK